MRVRIIKDFRRYQVGDVVILSREEAKLLIKLGIAIKSKDMNTSDMRTT